MTDPLCPPLVFQKTVDRTAGLKACILRGVIETVAVVAHFVVGHVPEVSWLFLMVVDQAVAVSVGAVHVQP